MDKLTVNMDKLLERSTTIEDFLDDCTATVEVIRVMQEKGVESIDEAGVTLKPEVFDRCFPGVEWSEGEFGIGIKTAAYAGFEFDAYRMEGEA